MCYIEEAAFFHLAEGAEDRKGKAGALYVYDLLEMGNQRLCSNCGVMARGSVPGNLCRCSEPHRQPCSYSDRAGTDSNVHAASHADAAPDSHSSDSDAATNVHAEAYAYASSHLHA
jgi:hypothetical protein